MFLNKSCLFYYYIVWGRVILFYYGVGFFFWGEGGVL